MLFAVLLRCYYHQGFGASITSPISRHVIECIGAQFVDDMNLYTYLPWLRSSHEVYLEMEKSVRMWCNLLCSTGGAIEPEKSYWYNVDYVCNKFGTETMLR